MESDSTSATMHPQQHKYMSQIADDLGLEEPQMWPISKKLGASVAGFGYAFATLYTATAYTAGIPAVAAAFNVATEKAVVPFSLFIFGVMFAPLYSPHVSEKIGRNRFYVVATLGMGLFTLGAAYSRTFAQLCVCRFFAGLFGGSNAVQIEGTFADVWPALFTSSYYTFVAGGQYFGAATGVVVSHHVVPVENYRWTQFTSLMVILGALFLGINAPETYRRELVRCKARQLKLPSPLAPALSGERLGDMVKLTIIDPVVMLWSQPLILAITLFMGFNFGVLFQFFISDPAVLTGAGFSEARIGSAFTTAIGGTAAAIFVVILIDQVVVRLNRRKLVEAQIDIEFRMFAAILGAILMFVALFMIAFTINPRFDPAVPIAGNGLFVMGSAMTLTAFVSYLFDAYGPQGTLSALTVVAVFRIALAGAIPLTAVPGGNNPGPKWFLTIWAIIGTVFLVFPIFVLFFGRKLRTESRFFNQGHPSMLHMEISQREKMKATEGSETA